ncbi:bifunctional 2-polyprenyl-6-hydroxyphenol methylase/3-demethylubiquinol 3-O-methyltransferase UbiG [Pontibacter sp. SGAir0037]|uniref:class I SAM-dependent methyltransferase n=1 Tax=Pontibacter sp. SGAir0037 TaxID=2571030 RepID=UPI0010CCF31B|nr:class I SAM-dependent methyltransferase [Pontibacter sp. SGAir0037]QCR20916.1 SAM-dependent methyltransferase [Pontibacter sp. SGAir0037]
MEEREKKHSEEHLGPARQYWWNEDYLELLAHRLHIGYTQSLVDIGCGKGMMGFKFSKYLPEGATVYGVDFEPDYIEEARQRAQSVYNHNSIHYNFSVGNASDLPLPDALADITLCQTLLIHVKDPQRVIEEMIRVTKPGGWVLALEPNNLVPNLMFDRYGETDFDVESTLEVLEVKLRIEKGKKRLGEGFNSLGDVIPDLFLKAGLQDINVWISDKALSIIPPYDTEEKMLRVDQMLQWIDSDAMGYDYQDNLNYFMAGGGDKDKFDAYWQKLLYNKITLKQKLLNEEYVSAGGSLVYIVAGQKPRH